MQPVCEELLLGALAHSGDGEVVLLAGDELDSVVVDGANFVERHLKASLRIAGTLEGEAGGTQRQLPGTASAKALFVARRVDKGRECGGLPRNRRLQRLRDPSLRGCLGCGWKL